MKINRRVLIIFSVLIILVMLFSTACLSPYIKPGKEAEAEKLLDELIDESSSDSEESEEANGDGELEKPEKKVSLLGVENEEDLGVFYAKIETQQSVYQNPFTGELFYNPDARGDGFFSDPTKTQGLNVGQNDIIGGITFQVEVSPDWGGSLPPFASPCGIAPDGSSITICPPDVNHHQHYNWTIGALVLDGVIPIMEPDYSYTYTFIADTDADPANNFNPQSPWIEDQYQNSDHWWILSNDPINPGWNLYPIQVGEGPFESEAWAEVNGNMVFFYIPTSELNQTEDQGIDNISYGMTAFVSDGQIQPETSGCDNLGNLPSDGLMKFTGDALYLAESEILMGMVLDDDYEICGPGCILNQKPVEGGQKTMVWCTDNGCQNNGGLCKLFNRGKGDSPQEEDSWNFVAEGDQKMQKDWDYVYHCFCVK